MRPQAVTRTSRWWRDIQHLLAGQRLGSKEVGDGIWLVSFIDYDLGNIDWEQRTLQPSTTVGPEVVSYERPAAGWPRDCRS